MRATSRQVEQLIHWAECFEKRTWAIKSGGGLGYLLTQELVARGEEVLDVPATLASRIRVLASERSNKNDPNDVHSIAIAALRSPRLRSVEPADHAEVLRLLAKRNHDIGVQRIRTVCRLHSLLAELAPGGIGNEPYVSDADALMADLSPQTPAQQMRFDLVLELLDDVRRLDAQTRQRAPSALGRSLRVDVDREVAQCQKWIPRALVGAAILMSLIGTTATVWNARTAFARGTGR